MITTLRNSQGQYFIFYSDKEKLKLSDSQNYCHYDNIDVHLQKNAIVYARNNKIFFAPTIQVIKFKLKAMFI